MKKAMILGMILISAALTAADWPRWRGPDRNAISQETEWNPQAIAQPKILWETNVGPGWSSVTVHGDRLYTMGNRDGQEIVWCLDARTGEEKWRYEYDCQPGNFPGPRATPVLDGGRLYTLSREGHLLCLDAKSGQKIWMRHLVNELHADNIEWGFSSSPLIEEDRVLVNATESGMAFNKKTGKLIWSGKQGHCGYATPVIYTFEGKKCVALFSAKAVFGVDFQTGQTLWSFPWVTDYDVNAADPIFWNDHLFISSGYDRGCALLKLSGDGVEKVWENKNMRNQVGTSVLFGGYLYGSDGNTGRPNSALSCVDIKTGERKWTQTIGHNALMAADGKLIVLTERGELIIASASPNQFEALARAYVIKASRKSPCWTMPVLAGGKIYCRNGGGDLVCVDVRQ